jgi:L-fuconolactonase
MRIVDAHCHASPVWFEPVETLLFQMDRIGIAQSVLMPLLGQYDHSYQQACVRAHPDRLIWVGAIDPLGGPASTQIRLQMDDGVSGFRLPADSALGDRDIEIWHAVSAAELPISCIGSAAQFASPAFSLKLASAHQVPIVLEHLGGLGRPDFNASVVSPGSVFALARHAQVYLKVPGFGQLAKRTAFINHPPIGPEAAEMLQQAILNFGGRLMWGSDFPPVATREGYANALEWPLNECSNLGESEKTQLFGGCAASVFSSR